MMSRPSGLRHVACLRSAGSDPRSRADLHRRKMAYPGFDLHGRTAVVVGGTSGIGQTIALGLAEAGADVVPSARRAEMVEATAKKIEGLGRRTLRVCSDVLDRPSLQSLLDATVARFGKADIMVYAAGRTKRTPFLEVGESE